MEQVEEYTQRRQRIQALILPIARNGDEASRVWRAAVQVPPAHQHNL